MRRCICIFASVLLWAGAIRAEENSGIAIRGFSFGLERNFLPSGNSVIFSVKDRESQSGADAQKSVSSDDVEPSYLRSNFELRVDFGDFAELWFRAQTQSEENRQLRSGGGEYSVMAPLERIGLNHWKIGYYHHSLHNFSDERYGDGIFIDGIQLEWEKTEIGSFPATARLWYTYAVWSEWSPYVFTSDMKEVSRIVLGRLESRFGLDLRLDADQHPMRLQITAETAKAGAWGDAGGLAAIRNRFDAGVLSFGALHIGLFTEYNENMRRRDAFGKNEWQAGISMQFQEGDSRP